MQIAPEIEELHGGEQSIALVRKGVLSFSLYLEVWGCAFQLVGLWITFFIGRSSGGLGVIWVTKKGSAIKWQRDWESTRSLGTHQSRQLESVVDSIFSKLKGLQDSTFLCDLYWIRYTLIIWGSWLVTRWKHNCFKLCLEYASEVALVFGFHIKHCIVYSIQLCQHGKWELLVFYQVNSCSGSSAQVCCFSAGHKAWGYPCYLLQTQDCYKVLNDFDCILTSQIVGFNGQG